MQYTLVALASWDPLGLLDLTNAIEVASKVKSPSRGSNESWQSTSAGPPMKSNPRICHWEPVMTAPWQVSRIHPEGRGGGFLFSLSHFEKAGECSGHEEVGHDSPDPAAHDEGVASRLSSVLNCPKLNLAGEVMSPALA